MRAGGVGGPFPASAGFGEESKLVGASSSNNRPAPPALIFNLRRLPVPDKSQVFSCSTVDAPLADTGCRPQAVVAAAVTNPADCDWPSCSTVLLQTNSLAALGQAACQWIGRERVIVSVFEQ